LICLGALPFMIVAARPSMLAASSVGYLIAMFYPVVAAVLSLMFISSIFDSALVPLLTEEPVRMSLQEHVVILLGLAPVTFVALMRNLFVARYLMPLLAAFGTICGAYWLNSVLHVESDPTLAIAPMLAVLAVTMRFWPQLALREPIIIVLLVLALILSLFSLRANPVDETRNWFNAVRGYPVEGHSATQEVAAFLEGKSGIIVDVERNPEIVTQIGDITNLIVAGQTVYDWALEGGILRAEYILVQNASDQIIETDRILRRYPALSTNQLAFYEEVFTNGRWRVFKRIES